MRSAGSSGRPANLERTLQLVLEALMESAGREVRRRAADAVRRAVSNGSRRSADV